jgi:hypothetical protein
MKMEFYQSSQTHLILDKLVTDGDVRRGILQGVELSAPVSEIMNTNPVSANASLSSHDLKALMQSRAFFNKNHVVLLKQLIKHKVT